MHQPPGLLCRGDHSRHLPGAVIGVVIAATLGLSHEGISMLLFLGALLMCIPLGALFSLARVGTSASAAGIVLTLGFALGYFLDGTPRCR